MISQGFREISARPPLPNFRPHPSQHSDQKCQNFPIFQKLVLFCFFALGFSTHPPPPAKGYPPLGWVVTKALPLFWSVGGQVRNPCKPASGCGGWSGRKVRDQIRENKEPTFRKFGKFGECQHFGRNVCGVVEILVYVGWGGMWSGFPKDLAKPLDPIVFFARCTLGVVFLPLQYFRLRTKALGMEAPTLFYHFA